jgi:hypothetical protein
MGENMELIIVKIEAPQKTNRKKFLRTIGYKK